MQMNYQDIFSLTAESYGSLLHAIPYFYENISLVDLVRLLLEFGKAKSI